MVLPIVGFNDGAFAVKSHAPVLSKHFNGIYVTVIFEDGAYLLSPDGTDTGTYSEERDALVPRVTNAARVVEDSQSSDEEEELHVVSKSPKPKERHAGSPTPIAKTSTQPPTKKKRMSSANASAMMAAGR